MNGFYFIPYPGFLFLPGKQEKSQKLFPTTKK